MDEKKLDEKRLFLGESEPLESVFKRFLKYFESDQLVTNQLHYILQALFQTLISNVLSETESRYLLAAILSPRYRIDTKRLEEELMFSYKSMGGKSKKAKIQRFEIYKNSLEYILLDSFEGAIKTDKVYLFGHFEQGPQFEYRHESTLYKSITVSCPLDHKFAERFVGKRIIFSSADRMGTDFPHWEVVIDEKHVARAFYVYANYEGAKPSFYYKKASDDLYHSLNTVFPGLDQTDWESQIEFNKGHDVWLEKIEEKVDSKRQAIKSELGGQCYQNGVPVKKLVYCGPLRSRFLGLFGYLLNIFNH
ncbi:MAG: hypothetical protein CME64_16585 [Halobacteriovoraceae bacterium]|nr:hypothetical protein [Halobacteriovoraceae bacterium]